MNTIYTVFASSVVAQTRQDVCGERSATTSWYGGLDPFQCEIHSSYATAVELVCWAFQALIRFIDVQLLRAVLSNHQNVVFRRQKRQIFKLKSSTYFTFYVGHSTRQGIFLLRV